MRLSGEPSLARDREVVFAARPRRKREVVGRRRPPCAARIHDEGVVLGMVVSVVREDVEDHSAEELDDVRLVLRQRSCERHERVVVERSRRPKVRIQQSGSRVDVPPTRRQAIEPLDGEIGVPAGFQEPDFRHVDPGALRHERIGVFLAPDLSGIVHGSELDEPGAKSSGSFRPPSTTSIPLRGLSPTTIFGRERATRTSAGFDQLGNVAFGFVVFDAAGLVGKPVEVDRTVALSPALANLYFRRFALAWRDHGHQDQLNAHIVNYADDFVICCRPGNAEEAMMRMQTLMTRLGLEVNENDQDRIARLPEDDFTFLGYTIGRFFGKDGRAYLGTRPSRKAVKSLLQHPCKHNASMASGCP